jgi:anti-anti-sigma factor
VQTTDRADGVRVVTVRGSVDVFSGGRLRRDAVAGLATKSRSVVLDLEGVSALDSGGLSAIVKLVRELRARDVDCHADLGHGCGLSPTMVALLREVVPVDDD